MANGLHWLLSTGSAFDVMDHRISDIDNAPPVLLKAKAPIEIFAVHEVRVIESADLSQH
jgi:hypothetical protein